MKIIGFDVSSSTIGYCVLDIDNNDKVSFVKCDFFKPTKKGDIFERLQFVKNNIEKLLKLYNPDLAGIEDFSKFISKKSSAQTIIQLALFNRMVGFTVFEYIKKSPELYNVISMRHALKLTDEAPKKEDIPNLVEKYLGIKFPYLYNKKNNIKPETYDMSDACLVAIYCAYKTTNKLSKIKRTRDLLK